MKQNMRQKNMQAYLFLSPFLVFITVLYILPAILTVIMAFTSLDSAFIWKFNGINNFRKILMDPNTPIIAWNTVKYSVLWLWLLEATPNGLANKVYMALGGSEPLNWIAQYPFVIIIAATLLTSIAYGTTVFSSAVKSIPENQFRAARVDGAGEWEIVRNIILPNLRFHITFIALWETLGLLTNYVTIMLITNGGPGVQTEVWALSAYHKAFSDSQYGYGAAISLVLIVVVMVLMLVIGAVMHHQEKSRS